MVLEPKKLVERIKQKDADIIARAEQSIDKTLEERFDGSSVAISTSTFKGARQMVVKELIAKYRIAGWDVQYVSDQRDGDFYQFTPKEYE